MNKKTNDHKNGRDFFELLENLDEDIVEDAWEEKSGKITIVEARTPLSVFRDIAAVAACIAVIAVGIYGFVRLNNIDVTPGESGTDYSESSDITSSPKKIPEYENTISFNGVNYAPKTDNEDYAVVYVTETNANQIAPLYLTIIGFNNGFGEDDGSVSETIKVTGPGEYTIHYTKLRGAGSMNYLDIVAGIEFETTAALPSIEGHWIP